MRVCASRRIQSKKKKSPRGGPIIDPAWAGQGMGMACQGRKGGKDRDAS